MSIHAFPIVPFLDWLNRQQFNQRQKTEHLFKKIAQVDLNTQDEFTLRCVGDTCMRLGANFENLIELGCSPATSCEWVQGICPLGRNQQFETLDALITDVAIANKLDVPGLHWHRVPPARGYDDAVRDQNNTLTPSKPTLRRLDRPEELDY